jgi:hypothetical protein
MQAGATKNITIAIQNASYLKNGATAQGLTFPVDASEPKKGEMSPRSKYSSTPQIHSWKELLPNPDHTQYVSTESIADLFTTTCLSYGNLDTFYNLFMIKMIDWIPSSWVWAVLDSPDIEPIWNIPRSPIPHTERSIGLRVKISNCGNKASAGTLSAKSIFLPYLANEIIIKNEGVPKIECAPGRMFVAFSSKRFDPINPDASSSVRIDYNLRELYYIDLLNPTDRERVLSGRIPLNRPDEIYVTLNDLMSIRKLMMINLVDISATEPETHKSNNYAVEIIPLTVNATPSSTRLRRSRITLSP